MLAIEIGFCLKNLPFSHGFVKVIIIAIIVVVIIVVIIIL